MKDTLLNIFIFLLFLLAVMPISAAPIPLRRISQKMRQDIRQGIINGSNPAEFRREIREKVKEELKERNPNLLDKIKDFIINFRYSAKITGNVTATGDKTLTVETNDERSYQVNITDKTKLRRRFWGNSGLEEFSVGNLVNVIGKWKDSSKTQIDAIIIRNLSVQRRHGIFFGEVTSLNSPSLIMKTVNRGDQTVVTDGKTEFIQRNQRPMMFNEIMGGHRIRVNGLWDKDLNKITEVKQIKDFSLPLVPTGTSISPTQGP